MKLGPNEHLGIADQRMAAAENLMGGNFPEDAITRIYYAMFHAATAALMKVGIECNSHRALISCFAQHLVKPGIMAKELQSALDDAFDARMDADYGSHTTMSMEKTREYYVSAREFIRKCKDFVESQKTEGPHEHNG